MQELNRMQTRAVQTEQNAVICLAGPGSGKTRVLASRIEWLVKHGTLPERIVAITFTNAAANELRSRLGGNIGHCGTLHTYLLGLLKAYGPALLGLPKRLAVIDEETSTGILQEVCREQNYKGSGKDLARALEVIPMLEPKQNWKGAHLVSAAYHERLLQNGLLDFNSILAIGLHLIRTYSQRMQYDIDGVFPFLAEHLLVDEYQDSGELDASIYAALPVVNRFFVGDPDQSIYGFRGARPDIMARQANSIGSWVTYPLNANYRSETRICMAANRLMAHCKDPLRYPKDISCQSKEYGEFEVNSFPDETAEARALASQFITMAEADLNQCAVLVRTNRLVDSLSDALRTVVPIRCKVPRDIPTDWQAARQMVAFLANPENDILAYRVLCRTRGKDIADRLKRESASDLTSINQYALHIQGVDVGGVPEALARGLIQAESIARVEQAIAGLQSPSITNLTLALADGDLHTEEEGSGVTVCTIHAAKGREWDRVYLPAWNEGVISRPGPDLEESRRIAFVAITRARKSLWVSWAEKRRAFPQAREMTEFAPSQFIKEIQIA